MKRGMLAGFILLCGSVLGQSPAPAFDSADVHVSAPSSNPTMRGGGLRGERFEIRTATMVDLISAGYDMESDKVLGGPNWLDWDRFDIFAKAPRGTSREKLNTMLQSLLADRFKLVVHKDKKPMPAFALTAGKSKPKMKEASGEQGGCQGQNGQNGEPVQIISCRSVTMATFADTLRGFAGGTYLPDPVVDQTGLTGNWDVELKFTPRNRLAQAGPDGITLFDAIDKQLGLKLEAQKIPLPVLMVDSVNQTPTPNAPGVTTQIPPAPPAEFEVATIKPSSPDARGQNGRLSNGRLDVQNFTLRQMIVLAWDTPGNNDDFVQGLPKSADSNRYDVAGKVSTTETVKADELDFDSLRLMLKSLLIERFEIKAHTEDRPVEAFTMTARQPKLQKADPQNRTSCKSGAGTNPMLNRLITCQNTSMAQLAVALQNIAGGYVRAPIKDATGLEGYYDFSVNFSGVNLLPGRAFDPNASSGTLDPNGSLTLPEALEKQLGLKLESQKRPLPVLVIDHVSDKPQEN